MSLTLAEARALVIEGVHSTTESYSNERVDRALQTASDEFLRETRAVTTTTFVTLTAGTHVMDLTAVVPKFVQTDFLRMSVRSGPEIHLHPIHAVDRYVRQQPQPTGTPTRCAFRTDSRLVFDRLPLANLDLELVHVATITPWTAGQDEDGFTLNLPSPEARMVAYWGGRAYLRHGLPGHPEADDDMNKFQFEVRRAMARYPEHRNPLRERFTNTTRKPAHDQAPDQR